MSESVCHDDVYLFAGRKRRGLKEEKKKNDTESKTSSQRAEKNDVGKGGLYFVHPQSCAYVVGGAEGGSH